MRGLEIRDNQGKNTMKRTVRKLCSEERKRRAEEHNEADCTEAL